MKADVRSVALDIVFDIPSSYGEANNHQFQQVSPQYRSIAVAR
ncbi:hypothetical protein [Trichormus sp. NMC-1]|nr:hypothetical protein [Trichormus sp. NMC-1]